MGQTQLTKIYFRRKMFDKKIVRSHDWNVVNVAFHAHNRSDKLELPVEDSSLANRGREREEKSKNENPRNFVVAKLENR